MRLAKIGSGTGQQQPALQVLGCSVGGLEEMVLLIRLDLHLYWVRNLQAKQIASDEIIAGEGQVLSAHQGASAPASSGVVMNFVWWGQSIHLPATAVAAPHVLLCRKPWNG